jgi:hypothetical protein
MIEVSIIPSSFGGSVLKNENLKIPHGYHRFCYGKWVNKKASSAKNTKTCFSRTKESCPVQKYDF